MKFISNWLQVSCIIGFFTLVFLSCKKENNNPDTYYGQQVTMGNGTARSYFIAAKDGTPMALGAEITDNAFTNLPADPLNFAASTFQLSIDQRAKDLTPYDRLEMEWNVNGHEPPGIYNLPHFDFHFYQGKAGMVGDVLQYASSVLLKHYCGTFSGAFSGSGNMSIGPGSSIEHKANFTIKANKD